MRIALLYGNNPIVMRNVIYPIVRWRQYCKDAGLRFTFHTKIDKRLDKSDCIILCDYSHVSATIYDTATINTIRNLRHKCGKLIFFDNRDSCGNTHFEILEHVDAYWKKQLYQDKALYRKPLQNSRLYCEYIQKTFGIRETLQEKFVLLDTDSHEKKIKVGWNIGVGPILQTNPVYTRLNMTNFSTAIPIRFFWETKAWRRLYKPWSQRTTDAHFRGTKNMILNSLTFARANIDTFLAEIADMRRVVFGPPVSRRKYMHEIFNSRAIISPFGYGEICYRDFEGFAAGACVLKPDMSHLETWPNFYIPDKTYIPYKWDFSDFLNRLDSCLGNAATGEAIAEQGRRVYLETQKDSWGEIFCARLLSLLAS